MRDYIVHAINLIFLMTYNSYSQYEITHQLVHITTIDSKINLKFNVIIMVHDGYSYKRSQECFGPNQLVEC